RRFKCSRRGPDGRPHVPRDRPPEAPPACPTVIGRATRNLTHRPAGGEAAAQVMGRDCRWTWDDHSSSARERPTVAIAAAGAPSPRSPGALMRSPRPALTLLRSEGAGGSLIRGMMPAAIAALLVLAFLRWLGEREGLYSATVGVVLMT